MHQTTRDDDDCGLYRRRQNVSASSARRTLWWSFLSSRRLSPRRSLLLCVLLLFFFIIIIIIIIIIVAAIDTNFYSVDDAADDDFGFRNESVTHRRGNRRVGVVLFFDVVDGSKPTDASSTTHQNAQSSLRVDFLQHSSKSQRLGEAWEKRKAHILFGGRQTL